MIRFVLKQKATSLPSRKVDSRYKVVKHDEVILVYLPDGWIRLDLGDNSYAVGDYEG